MDGERLELVRGLVNTFDTETGVDDLDSPAVLAEWLSVPGLLPPDAAATASDLTRTRALREALRDLLLENAGLPGAPSAYDALDRQAQRSRVMLGFGDGGRLIRPDGWRGRCRSRPHPGLGRRARWPTGRGPGSRRAAPTTAAGRSSTARGTARGTGATCACAATARRRACSGLVTARAERGRVPMPGAWLQPGTVGVVLALHPVPG